MRNHERFPLALAEKDHFFCWFPIVALGLSVGGREEEYEQLDGMNILIGDTNESAIYGKQSTSPSIKSINVTGYIACQSDFRTNGM